MNLLAAIEAKDIVGQLLIVLVVGIAILLIWLAGKWFLTSVFKVSPGILTGWNALFVLLGLFFAVNFLLGLVGYPLVKWK